MITKLPARGGDSAHESVAVSLFLDVYDARAKTCRNVLRTVGASVVCNYDLTLDVVFGKRTLGLANAGRKRVCFIQTGHYHGDFDMISVPVALRFTLRQCQFFNCQLVQSFVLFVARLARAGNSFPNSSE